MTDGALRMRVFAFIALVLFGGLVARLWYLQGLEAQREELQQRAQTNVLEEVYEEAPRGASSTATAGSSSTTRSLRWSRSTAGSSTTSTRSARRDVPATRHRHQSLGATHQGRRHRRPIRRPFLRSVRAGTRRSRRQPRAARVSWRTPRSVSRRERRAAHRAELSLRHDGRASTRLCRPNHPNRVASPQPADRSGRPGREDVPAQPRDREDRRRTHLRG